MTKTILTLFSETRCNAITQNSHTDKQKLQFTSMISMSKLDEGTSVTSIIVNSPHNEHKLNYTMQRLNSSQCRHILFAVYFSSHSTRALSKFTINAPPAVEYSVQKQSNRQQYV